LYPALYLSLLLRATHTSGSTLYSNLISAVDSGECLLELTWNNTYNVASTRLLPIRLFLQNFTGEHDRLMSANKRLMVQTVQELESQMGPSLSVDDAQVQQDIERADAFAEKSGGVLQHLPDNSSASAQQREKLFGDTSLSSKIELPCYLSFSRMISVSHTDRRLTRCMSLTALVLDLGSCARNAPNKRARRAPLKCRLCSPRSSAASST
jgi:hypothetical protein